MCTPVHVHCRYSCYSFLLYLQCIIYCCPFSDAPSVDIYTTTTNIIEGNNITFLCNASGKPQPTIVWTMVGSSVVLPNTSSLTIVNVSRPGTPDNMIQYQCTASNGVETPATATVNVTVHCE